MVGLRRRIAEKMVVSNTQIPHFSYIEEIDITELESLREHLNASRTDGQPKLTYLPFIMLSVTRALARFPQLNAHYDVKREVITRFEAVHLGIATQTDRGLCVPVVRHAEAMDLWQAAREMRRITEAARNHSISRDELTGSTFTVTSLGRMGGLAATPIINHPEVAILGINKATDRPVVHQGPDRDPPDSACLRLVRPPRGRRRRRGDVHPVREGLSRAPGDDLHLASRKWIKLVSKHSRARLLPSRRCHCWLGSARRVVQQCFVKATPCSLKSISVPPNHTAATLCMSGQF